VAGDIASDSARASISSAAQASVVKGLLSGAQFMIKLSNDAKNLFQLIPADGGFIG
jgi:hypothetical protein